MIQILRVVLMLLSGGVARGWASRRLGWAAIRVMGVSCVDLWRYGVMSGQQSGRGGGLAVPL